MANDKKKKKKKYYKGKGEGKKTSDEVANEGTNDVAWYKNQIKLFESVANVNYANVLGLTLPTLESKPTEAFANVSLPSIMTLKYHTCFGVSTDASSDVNVMANDIYAWVRHKNSGSRNYEAPDYMTYLLAMSGAYALYGEMVRLYGLTNVYSHMNRAINRGLIEALGYDYDNVVTKREKLLYFINYYATRLNAFCVPKSFDVYVKHMAMPLGVWKDADDDKAGLYLFQPHYIWKWSGTAYETGSALISEPFDAHTVEQLIDLGDQLLIDLSANEDIGIMSGDTKKAFGDSLFTISGIDMSYATPIAYSEEILAQIHHAIPTGPIVSGKDITQENGSLRYNPTFGTYSTSSTDSVAAAALAKLQPLLDCGWKTPSADYNMIASRLMVTFNGDASGFFADALPDTFIIRINIRGPQDWTDDNIATATRPVFPFASGGAGLSMPTADFRYVVTKSYFDWSPISYGAGPFVGSSINVLPIGEVFNYAVLSKVDLAKLHTVANLSLMTVKETKLL